MKRREAQQAQRVASPAAQKRPKSREQMAKARSARSTEAMVIGEMKGDIRALRAKGDGHERELATTAAVISTRHEHVERALEMLQAQLADQALRIDQAEGHFVDMHSAIRTNGDALRRAAPSQVVQHVAGLDPEAAMRLIAEKVCRGAWARVTVGRFS
jgi:hypothetical protein